MSFHRKTALRALVSPPIPLSTFNDMVADGRVPPPDAYNGRIPLWGDESREKVKSTLLNATRPRLKRGAKPAAGVEKGPTT